MVNINLLPWREHLRTYHKQQFKKILCFSSLLSMAILLGMYLLITWQETVEREHVVHLQQELNQLVNVQHSPRTFAHHEDVAIWQRQLEQYSAVISRLFMAFTHEPNADVCLTQVKQEDQAIILMGKTRSTLDLTMYLQQWHAAHLFSALDIEQLKQDGHRMIFRLRAVTPNTLPSLPFSTRDPQKNAL